MVWNSLSGGIMQYLEVKRKVEKKLLQKPAEACPFSPNTLTFFSVLLGFVSGYFILEGMLVYSALFFLTAVLLDALDGQVARAKRISSKFGSFFDKVADRIVDMTLLSSILLSGLVPLPAGLFTLCVIVLASYSSAVAEAESRKKHLGEGMSLRPLRSAILFLGLLSGQLEPAVFLLLITGLYSLEKRLLVSFQLLS